jgi:hypothetical protein
MVVSLIYGTGVSIPTGVVVERCMIVLAYLGSQCTKFHAVRWMFRFLRPFIWSRVMDATASMHQILCADL